jgi:hypothetical protein
MGELTSVIDDLARLCDVGLALAHEQAATDAADYLRFVRGENATNSSRAFTRSGRRSSSHSGVRPVVSRIGHVDRALRSGS